MKETHNGHTYEWVKTTAENLYEEEFTLYMYFIDGFYVAKYEEDLEDKTCEVTIFKQFSKEIRSNFFVRDEVEARKFIEVYVKPWVLE